MGDSLGDEFETHARARGRAHAVLFLFLFLFLIRWEWLIRIRAIPSLLRAAVEIAQWPRPTVSPALAWARLARGHRHCGRGCSTPSWSM